MGRTITVTIDEEGDQVFLKGHGADVFLGLGDTRTQRASHVEPDNWLLRFVFHVVRSLVADASFTAQWTRTWKCLWRVNTAPVGGPLLHYRHLKHNEPMLKYPLQDWDAVAVWHDRKAAIEAEVEFLNQFFFTGEKI